MAVASLVVRNARFVVKGLCVSLNLAVIRELMPSATRNLPILRTVIRKSCIDVGENQESNSCSSVLQSPL